MTIPWLMNCDHQGEGWCLECVGKLARERDAALAELTALKVPKTGCPACDGRGHIYEGGHDGWVRCRECNGTGETKPDSELVRLHALNMLSFDDYGG